MKYLQSKWPTSQDYIELHDSLHLPLHEIKVSQWKRIITGSWLWKRNVSTARKPVEERFDCAACKHANPSACRLQRIYIDGHGKLYVQKHFRTKACCFQMYAGPCSKKKGQRWHIFFWLIRAQKCTKWRTYTEKRHTTIDINWPWQVWELNMLTAVHGCCEDIEKGLWHCVRFHVMAPGMRTSEVSLGFYQLASLAESSSRKKKIAVNSASFFNFHEFSCFCFLIFLYGHGVWRSSQLLGQFLPYFGCPSLQDFYGGNSEESSSELSIFSRLQRMASKCLRSVLFINFIVMMVASSLWRSVCQFFFFSLDYRGKC